MNSSKSIYIVKISFDCNMRCLYCLEGDKSGRMSMSGDTLHSLISKAGNHAINTRGLAVFVWHGGEPLLPGIGFYQKVVDEQKAFGSEFRYINSLQTNGVLLNDSFADFFAKNNFEVGVSLDGPPIIHDAQRRSINTGTFGKAYKGYQKLKERDMNPGTLAVCTRNTLNHLDEFYDFFRDRAMDVIVRPLTYEGRAKSDEAASLQISPQEYGDALVTLFDKWKYDGDRFTMDPFRTYLRTMADGYGSLCSQIGQCQNYLDVFPNGDLYNCGRPSDAQNKLGNINTSMIADVLNSPKQKEYAQVRQAMRDICANKCEYVSICNGGCTRNSYLANPDELPQDYWCESYKRMFGHIKSESQKYLQNPTSLDCV